METRVIISQHMHPVLYNELSLTVLPLHKEEGVLLLELFNSQKSWGTRIYKINFVAAA